MKDYKTQSENFIWLVQYYHHFVREPEFIAPFFSHVLMEIMKFLIVFILWILVYSFQHEPMKKYWLFSCKKSGSSIRSFMFMVEARPRPDARKMQFSYIKWFPLLNEILELQINDLWRLNFAFFLSMDLIGRILIVQASRELISSFFLQLQYLNLS